MSADRKTSFKRKFISLETKITILNRLLNGERVTDISKSLNLNEATIRTIKKNEKEIRSAVAAGSSTSARYSARPRMPIIEKMEKALSIWIDDCCTKRIPLGGNMIRAKAVKIYNRLKEIGESSINPDFVGSKGWLEKFKKRYAIHNVKIEGESASADHEAAKTYPHKIQKIIEEQGYTPHQVFNADETALWWKKMPNRTFISKKEKSAAGFKASKDRITLLLCSNASGDLMTKPLLVNKSLNPRVLKGVNKNNLPVHWRANSKAWVTKELFKDWFFNCFVPEVENYLMKNNLSFKVLLLLDNAPGHPQDLSHPNVRIEFLPPNTTSLIQPLDQGIIYTFKSYYIRRSLQWILEAMHSKTNDIMGAWKEFSIKTCMDIILLAMKELKKQTLNGCWKKIWPSSVESCVPLTENGVQDILEVAKTIGGEGFADMNIEDVQNLLVEQEASEEDLVLMISQDDPIESEDSTDEENSEAANFSLKKVQKVLNLAKDLELYILSEDPCSERSLKFKRELQNALSPYSEIYQALTRASKQTKITDFIRKEKDGKNPTEEKDEEPSNKRLRLVISSDEETY